MAGRPGDGLAEPPGIPAVTSPPGRPLGGDAAAAASVVDDLGRLAEAGLTTCTLWLPIAAEHVEKAMDWIAAEVTPRLPLHRTRIPPCFCD